MLDSTPQDTRVFTSSHSQESERTLLSSTTPIYFFHVPEKPFCSNDRCPCHQNQAQIAVLLDAIRAGEMTLHEAANFADGKTF